jgi:hypothetical protein
VPTCQDLIDVLGEPVMDVGYAYAYFTEYYIYEFLYDSNGYLTDDFYVFYRTDEREIYY